MKELDELLSLSPGARFRKADLHVHTPASADFAPDEKNATPDSVIQAALDAGLEVIAITDHNTAEWCDKVREAAEGTSLAVLPGAEISTPQGHLVAIFDRGFPSEQISGLLMNAGILVTNLGNLDVATTANMWDVAELVEKQGGVAIAAHVDTGRGLMALNIPADVKRRAFDGLAVRGFEVGSSTARDRYLAGVPGYSRRMACIQSSDCLVGGAAPHRIAGIGSRHSHLKMDEVSVEGIKQALLDPVMRVKLVPDARPVPEIAIEGMWVTGGFLQGQRFRFADDLSCLIGGTGAGKSLTLELLRFALEQQTTIPKIAQENQSLLKESLGLAGKVYVLLRRGTSRYLVEREYANPSPESLVFQVAEDGSLEHRDDVDVSIFFPIKAFSQSEIIEFARDSEARRSLIDDLIDLQEERSSLLEIKGRLRASAQQMRDMDARMADSEKRLKDLPVVRAEIQKLAKFFQDPEVNKHDLWRVESSIFDGAAQELVNLLSNIQQEFPELAHSFLPDEMSEGLPNRKLLETIGQIETDLTKKLDDLKARAEASVVQARGELAKKSVEWKALYDKAEAAYQKLLEVLDQGSINLRTLDARLQQFRERERTLQGLRRELTEELRPARATLDSERETALDELQEQRKAIRRKRQDKANELTKAMGQMVEVHVRHAAESGEFFGLLQAIKVGSRIPDDDIRVMANELHPVKFVKSLLTGDYDELGKVCNLDRRHFERLHALILEEERLDELYEIQIVDIEDRIDCRLSVGANIYKDLEALAHGQKCTVILMVALAEGNFPVLADQPEDALHAEFIEKHIVNTLRDRRGLRQYIFSTRNANILVSGDAEQVFVLQSDAKRGWIQRTGSIDGFETRDLIMLNLEGGADAFSRRSQKYYVTPLT